MKESGAFQVMSSTNTAIIEHDDRLLLRAQKSDIGLELEWRDTVEICFSDGQPIIIDYWTSDDEPKRASIEEWQAMTWQARQEYRPQYERGLTLADKVAVSFKCNQMDLRICNLFEDAGSRYRAALEYMIQLVDNGTMKYRPRSDEGNVKNKQETVRNRIKRYLRPTEYEHDILFRGVLGQAMMTDLKSHDKADMKHEGTAYLSGYKRYDGQVKSVKFYDIGKRDVKQEGEYFKLETTFHKHFFKSKGIMVNEMTWQADIQEKILDELVKTVSNVIGLCSGGTQAMLAQALNVEAPNARTAPRTIAQAMLKRELTYGERLDALERKQAQHDRDIEQLKRATGLK